MTEMPIEQCDCCSCDLEPSQIGLCMDCASDSEARHGGEALRRFINTTGVAESDALADMLESLMHWCVENDYDFKAELCRAAANFSN